MRTDRRLRPAREGVSSIPSPLPACWPRSRQSEGRSSCGCAHSSQAQPPSPRPLTGERDGEPTGPLLTVHSLEAWNTAGRSIHRIEVWGIARQGTSPGSSCVAEPEPGGEQVWAPSSAGRRLAPSASWLRTKGRPQFLQL